MATIDELKALALQIRDADEDRENTALKVGQFLYDLLGYLDTKADLSMKGQWSKQLSLNQTPIVALQSVEAIPDSQGQNNKMWWSSDDGQLKWKSNDEVYPLGIPTYILYYCGNKIYKWSGSTTGFVDMTHAVINDLTTGGEGDALSAEMGIRLKSAIIQLWTAIGNYAFPGGRPMLDFSGGSQTEVAEVSTIFGQHVTPYAGESDVSVGDSLTVQLSTSDDLYVIDPSTVKVMMGGTDVTSTCYNENTDVVNIPTVADDVEITANAMTYVGYGETNSPLVSMFDGKNRGGDAGQWKDLIVQTRILTMTNCTENSDNVYFNGQDAKAVLDDAEVGVDVGAAAGTIECVFKMPTLSSSAFNFPVTNHPKSGTRLLVCGLTNSSGTILACCYQSIQSGDSGVPNAWTITGDYTKSYLSMSNTRAYHNGAALSRANAPYSGIASSNSRLAFFSFKGSNGTQYYREGSLYCVRFYSRPLNVDEIEKNYKIDRKRFNLQ